MENQKSNLIFLQEQMKFRKEAERFEKETALRQAKMMNMTAQEEIERENKRNKEQKMRRIKNKDELKTQGRLNSNGNNGVIGIEKKMKKDQFRNMTEQERLMNRERLEVTK